MAISARSAAATPSPAGGRLPRPRRLVAVLAVTQTVGYGVLTYAFPVLLQPIATDLHVGTTTVTGALTLAVVTAAGAAIPVGRWLDRRGGRSLMTAGSLLGAGAVLAWSQVRDATQLYAVFVLIGLASAMALYEPAFAVIVAAVDGPRRNDSLVAVTIVAGFASSIFFPVTGLLLDRHGWRTTLVVLAALLAAVTVPGHAVAVPARRHHAPRHPGTRSASARRALRDRTFWLLAIGFVAHAAAVSAMGVHLVGLLRSAGHATTVAAALAGLLGVLSVTGRLVTTGLARRHSLAKVTAVVFAIQAVGAAGLPLLGHSVVGAASCVTAFGLGFGVATIARPAILADRYGTAGYATIAATMATPMTLAKAGGPLAPAVLSPTSFPVAVAAACLLAAICLYPTASHRTGRDPDPEI